MDWYEKLVKRAADWEKKNYEKYNRILSNKGIDRYELEARSFLHLVLIMLVGGPIFIFSDDLFGWRVQVGVFLALLVWMGYWLYIYVVKPYRMPTMMEG